VYNLIEKFKQVKEEKIVEEARTRMRTRSENLYSKKMVKVYIMYIYIYIYIYIYKAVFIELFALSGFCTTIISV